MIEDIDINKLIPDNIDPIDIDCINDESDHDAKEMVRTITDIFYDEQFKEKNPKEYRRIHMEIETLRGLLKMRKINEMLLDSLVTAVTENKGNGQLYRSTSELQKTSIQITNKIHDTMDRLNNICKDFKMIVAEKDMESNQDGANIHKGSKNFIQSQS